MSADARIVDNIVRAEIRGRLNAQLVAELPSLIVAHPGAVEAALDICADLLGMVLGLSRLAGIETPYVELVTAAMLRADRYATEHLEAAIAAAAPHAEGGRA